MHGPRVPTFVDICLSPSSGGDLGRTGLECRLVLQHARHHHAVMCEAISIRCASIYPAACLGRRAAPELRSPQGTPLATMMTIRLVFEINFKNIPNSTANGPFLNFQQTERCTQAVSQRECLLFGPTHIRIARTMGIEFWCSPFNGSLNIYGFYSSFSIFRTFNFDIACTFALCLLTVCWTIRVL